MATCTEVLLQILEDLGNEDFQKFKWYLWQKDVLKEFPPIKKSRLENADRKETVDQVVQTYGTNTAEVVKMVLVKINQNNLVEYFSETITELTGESWKAFSQTLMPP